MEKEGPQLERLLRRLSECPAEFIETCTSQTGYCQLVAVISDHFREYGIDNPLKHDELFLKSLAPKANVKVGETRHWGILAIVTWLMHDSWFFEDSHYARPVWQLMQSDSLQILSEIISPNQFVSDPDRREELVRTCLSLLGLRPKGESIAQAKDRQMTLNSAERQRILQATAQAEKRAREVREAMARQKALESASRYGE